MGTRVAVLMLALVALTAVACGVRIEVDATPGADPTPKAGVASAGVVDIDGGTLSSTRYPIEVGGRLNTLRPKDAIHPIYDPPFSLGAENYTLAPSDLVIGVSLNGDSRAYAVRTLRHREMVKDVVGGVPILATW